MIVVLLPSRDERKTIAHVTHVVDEGLASYRSGQRALILNVDNGTDDTPDVFSGTPTVMEKQSIRLSPELVGKGYNITAGLSKGLDIGATCFIMLDTDLCSIEPGWISKFLDAINEGAAYVVPKYSRNRFEGNTTTHFSSPIIAACWRQDIEQPIAGDFAFRAEVAKQFLSSRKYPSDFRYGVDTALTWTALAHGQPISQIELGRKIHNPSFGKIKGMFQEVCASTLFSLFESRHLLRNHRVDTHLTEMLPTFVDTQHVVPPSSEAVTDLRRCSDAMLVEQRSIYNSHDVDGLVWADELSKVIGRIIRCDQIDKIDMHGETLGLSALYYARTCNHIEQIKELSLGQIASLIRQQREWLVCKTEEVLRCQELHSPKLQKLQARLDSLMS